MAHAVASQAIESGRYVPSDWVRVETHLSSALESYITESALQFDGGWIEVRQFKLARQAESVWTTSRWSYFFDVALGPRPTCIGTLLGPGTCDPPKTLSRIMVVPPGQKVRSGSCAGLFRSMRCVLDAKMIDRILQRKAEWHEKSVRHAFRLSGGQIEWLLLKMYREVREARFASSNMVQAFAEALCVEVIRQFQLDRVPLSERVGKLAPWRMRLLRDRIFADAPVPSLAELAQLCDLTVRHLNRAFRAETGQTLGKFVEAAMIERARTLLHETEAPIGEIARSLGFATSGSFAHAFRRITGLLPSEVERRQAK